MEGGLGGGGGLETARDKRGMWRKANDGWSQKRIDQLVYVFVYVAHREDSPTPQRSRGQSPLVTPIGGRARLPWSRRRAGVGKSKSGGDDGHRHARASAPTPCNRFKGSSCAL